jgi:hypothetical protein
MSKIIDRIRAGYEWMRGFLYGLMIYDTVRVFRRQRADLEHLFVDLIGVPILPPYYSLRLLPYIVPILNVWRRRMLRERDLTELAVD